jgi:hypothetical protein
MLHALSCLTSRLSVSNWMLLILKALSPAMTFWRATTASLGKKGTLERLMPLARYSQYLSELSFAVQFV